MLIDKKLYILLLLLSHLCWGMDEAERPAQRMRLMPLEERLHAACVRGDQAGILDAFNDGATIDTELDRDRHCALHILAQYGHVELVDWLIHDMGDNPHHQASFFGEHSIHSAATGGSIPMVNYLHRNQSCSLEARTRSGEQPIHLAAADGHLQLLEWLRQNGISMMAANDNHRTPVEFAAYGGHLGCVQWFFKLSEFGEELDRERDLSFFFSGLPIREKIMLEAASGGNIELVRWLQQQGTSIIIQDSRTGQTMMHHAAASGSVPMLAFLYSQNISINVLSANGLSPLYRASLLSQPQAVEWLLQHGANVNLRNEENDSIFDKAIRGPEGLNAETSYELRARRDNVCELLWTYGVDLSELIELLGIATELRDQGVIHWLCLHNVPTNLTTYQFWRHSLEQSFDELTGPVLCDLVRGTLTPGELTRSINGPDAATVISPDQLPTMLTWAAARNASDIVTYLIDNGNAPYPRDVLFNAMRLAAGNGNHVVYRQIQNYLAETYAEPTIAERADLIWLAIMRRQFEVLDTLFATLPLSTFISILEMVGRRLHAYYQHLDLQEVELRDYLRIAHSWITRQLRSLLLVGRGGSWTSFDSQVLPREIVEKIVLYLVLNAYRVHPYHRSV